MVEVGSPRRQDTMGGAPAQTRSERVLEKPNEPPLSECSTSREAEEESTMAFELIKFIKSMLEEHGMVTAYLLLYVDDIVLTASSQALDILSYKKYVVEILERAHMVNCNPSQTLVTTESKLGIDGNPVSDPTLYRSLSGSLQYLTFTRLDI
ncbi:ribonuclease H-like domain-containing protein [Tanacetum coccineum]